jgi:hypothetical protein
MIGDQSILPLAAVCTMQTLQKATHFGMDLDRAPEPSKAPLNQCSGCRQ